MTKPADYFISAVRYNQEETHITHVKRHAVISESDFDTGKEMFRKSVVEDIKDNIRRYATIYKDKNGDWTLGKNVIVINVKGTDYIKTMDNNKEEDNLENLPLF